MANSLHMFSPEWMEQFRQVVNEDRELSWIARWMTCDFVWRVGEAVYLFHVVGGKVISVVAPTWNDSWDFAIEGTEEAWSKFAQPLPPPMYYDLLGMVTRLPECRLTGNRLKAMQHIRSLTRMMSLVREVGGETR
ncbi:hypothetical protein P9G84_11325 [Brevibacillus centrosporus]|uniref:hypothetical protein n=1 Tax=Brevibacillus centrosporus TaxID=54910 RepID=UPI000F0A8922|nr:hypothetical protein [Brevibacillus centrosporus]MEC2129562.1 hypothetical protein [Brevibacillus centrosporus]RNB65451.1 hypothetical protein EDM55_24685 [Brevibacillus centrosporus]GED29916.1 hypothetical protein BCE02nite_10570 [Brevibacillus centrosporus]